MIDGVHRRPSALSLRPAGSRCFMHTPWRRRRWHPARTIRSRSCRKNWPRCREIVTRRCSWLRTIGSRYGNFLLTLTKWYNCDEVLLLAENDSHQVRQLVLNSHKMVGLVETLVHNCFKHLSTNISNICPQLFQTLVHKYFKHLSTTISNTCPQIFQTLVHNYFKHLSTNISNTCH